MNKLLLPNEVAVSTDVMLFLADTTGWFDVASLTAQFQGSTPNNGCFARVLAKLFKVKAIAVSRPPELGSRKAIRLRTQARMYIQSTGRSEIELAKWLAALFAQPLYKSKVRAVRRTCNRT
jgi:hypothetical protein